MMQIPGQLACVIAITLLVGSVLVAKKCFRLTNTSESNVAARETPPFEPFQNLKHSVFNRPEPFDDDSSSSRRRLLGWGEPKVSEEIFRVNLMKTTKLLYENSKDAQFWIKQPPPKIYVYDDLPNDLVNITYISERIDKIYLGLDDSTPRADIPIKQRCRWGPKICDSLRDLPPETSWAKTFLGHRNNFMSDVAFVEWFNHYPFQTRDPNEADLFVVPFPYFSFSLQSGHRGRDDYASMERMILSRLPYFNEKTKARHLWFTGCDWKIINGYEVKKFFQEGIALTLGASPCKPTDRKPCSTLVNPYLDTAPKYQPRMLLRQPYWDNMAERPYALACVFGLAKNRVYRIRFYAEQEILGKEIFGKEIFMGEISHANIANGLSDKESLYSKSIFCAILPGDLPPSKRFFDAMLNGCIPLVPRFYNSTNAPGYPSSHDSKHPFARSSIPAIYPYSRELQFFNVDGAGLDWMNDIMVTFDGSCGALCARREMERVLSNMTELQRLQDNIKRYVPLFSYGLEQNMYHFVDAFYAILVNIRHYLYLIRQDVDSMSVAK